MLNDLDDERRRKKPCFVIDTIGTRGVTSGDGSKPGIPTNEAVLATHDANRATQNEKKRSASSSFPHKVSSKESAEQKPGKPEKRTGKKKLGSGGRVCATV